MPFISLSLANIRRCLLCRTIERCSEWVSSDSACPEKTNCESGSGSQSSGNRGRRREWERKRERGNERDLLDPEGDNAGSRRPVRLGLLRVFECVDDPASLPIVGENRKVLDTHSSRLTPRHRPDQRVNVRVELSPRISLRVKNLKKRPKTSF